MKKFMCVSLITSLTLLAGCASITSDSSSSVSVQTRTADGKEVTGARCEMANKRGKYFVTTPGTIMLQGSNDDLMITCRAEGHDNGMAQVVSETKGNMFANIILGGGIGAFVDHSNGSAYRYPSFIEVTMGNTVIIGSPKDDDAENCVNTMGQNNCAKSNKNKVNLSKEDKLKELKKLKDDGLIDEDSYKKYQDQVLSNDL